MSWTYEQSSGWLIDPSGKRLAQGYSGSGEGKNVTEMQDVPNVGPIPVGEYTIGSMRQTVNHGPDAMPLTPDPLNEMFGRSEFWIHGDSVHNPGTASEGCIIQPRFARDRIAESDDKDLRVLAVVASSGPVNIPIVEAT